MRSGGVWLSSATPEVIDSFLNGLSSAALMALPWMFEFWALPHQLPPEGAWKSWVIMGGRGAGKTRAGAEWVRAQVEGARPQDPGRASRVALVAETLDQAREVARHLRAGTVNLNYPAWDTFAPFGGYKQSGNDREYADWGIHDFVEVKALIGFGVE